MSHAVYVCMSGSIKLVYYGLWMNGCKAEEHSSMYQTLFCVSTVNMMWDQQYKIMSTTVVRSSCKEFRGRTILFHLLYLCVLHIDQILESCVLGIGRIYDVHTNERKCSVLTNVSQQITRHWQFYSANIQIRCTGVYSKASTKDSITANSLQMYTTHSLLIKTNLFTVIFTFL